MMKKMKMNKKMLKIVLLMFIPLSLMASKVISYRFTCPIETKSLQEFIKQCDFEDVNCRTIIDGDTSYVLAVRSLPNNTVRFDNNYNNVLKLIDDGRCRFSDSIRTILSEPRRVLSTECYLKGADMRVVVSLRELVLHDGASQFDTDSIAKCEYEWLLDTAANDWILSSKHFVYQNYGAN